MYLHSITRTFMYVLHTAKWASASSRARLMSVEPAALKGHERTLKENMEFLINIVSYKSEITCWRALLTCSLVTCPLVGLPPGRNFVECLNAEQILKALAISKLSKIQDFRTKPFR